MGGPGSGRRYRWDKKTTVEDCQELDVIRLYQEGLLGWDRWWSGAWAWTNSRTGKVTSRIGLEIDTHDRAFPWVRLHYTFTSGRNEGKSLDYKIALQTTQPNYGGWRWWFTCPLSVAGQECQRRVRKLYCPPGGLYYGCRHCYDLTYRSCQESDKRVSALVRQMREGRIDPMALMSSNNPDFLLALKAWERVVGFW